MTKIPRMNRVMRRQLIQLGRRSGEPATALRFHAVSRLALGRSSPQVAEELALARSTVVKAAERFAKEGTDGLYDKRHGNGHSKVDVTFRRRVTELLRGTPEDFGWCRPTWTRELMCLQMVRDGWPKVAVCTMGRALAFVGARLGMPKPVVLCPWPRDERLRVLADIRRLEGRASADEPVLYSDEVDVHLNPKIGRDWMLRGHQRRIVTPGKNKSSTSPARSTCAPGGFTRRVPSRRTPRSSASSFGFSGVTTAALDAFTSSSTITEFTRPISRATPSSACAVASCCTSSRRIALMQTASSESGRTFTPTSRATTGARR